MLTLVHQDDGEDDSELTGLDSMRDDQELLEFPIDRGELLHDSGYEEGNGWAQMPRFLPRSPEQRAAWRAYLGQYVDTWVGYREQHLPPLLRPIFVHRWLPSFC